MGVRVRVGNIAVVVIVCLLAAMTAANGATAGDTATVQTRSPLGNKDGGKAETALGDLFADALRAAVGAEIAFVSSSEIKPKDPPFPSGGVSGDDIADLVSYPDDPLALLELSGKAIRQALERAVSIYPQPNLGFLQISGLSFEFNPTKGSGERVVKVMVGANELNDSKTYSVGVTNSMANGALGYWKIWSNDNVRKRLADQNMVKAIENYLKANPVIDYGTLSRITVR